MRIFILSLTGILVSASALGATPEAWRDHQKQVVAACTAASELHNAKLGGDIVEFDDQVGYTAAVIEGRYPQSHMKNRRGRVLCLFDKRIQRAWVSPADSIIKQ